VFQIPPDKHRFRRVLLNVFMLPCGAAWLYVLLFYVPYLFLAVALALVLGLGTAFLVALGLQLLGRAMVGALDRWLGQDSRK